MSNTKIKNERINEILKCKSTLHIFGGGSSEIKEMGLQKSDNSLNQSNNRGNMISLGENYPAKSSNSISSDARKDDINLINHSSKLQIFDDNISNENKKR